MPNVIAVIVLSTDDPLLTEPVTGSFAPIRAAVVAALPSLSRVVAIMPEDEGKLMLAGHLMASEAAGMGALTVLRERGPAGRRPRRIVH
jgi:hypothetical protein